MIVEIAQKEIGYKEQPGNKTKYGQWFGLNGVAWCAIFVSWVYAKAGKPLSIKQWSNGFAGCQYGYEYWTKKNKIITDPQPGDIVLYDFNGDGRRDHTGIFVRWVGKDKFEAIEGNTALKNQTNGGEVMLRVRNKKIAVFVRP